MGTQPHPQNLLKFILNRFTSGGMLSTWLIEACDGTLQGPRREVNRYFMEVLFYCIFYLYSNSLITVQYQISWKAVC